MGGQTFSTSRNGRELECKIEFGNHQPRTSTCPRRLAGHSPRPVFDLYALNPEQREAAITHRGPVLILAGAGTGKTRVITCRIVHMIDRGVRPGNILAVTFTNKAAREMLERVNEMLPRERKRERGEEKPERPTLCTFHSLCVRILRQSKRSWRGFATERLRPILQLSLDFFPNTAMEALEPRFSRIPTSELSRNTS